MFAFLGQRPLHYTDLWGHLAYGRWICTHHALPATEPFLPLAQGVSIIDTAWLCQVLGYQLEFWCGPGGMQFVSAALVTLICAVLTRLIFRETKSQILALGGVAWYFIVHWNHFQVIRPQLAGLLSFVVLLWLLGRWRKPRWTGVAIPVVVALWANLHGSFPMGLMLLASCTAGRALDITLRTRHWQAALRDHPTRRLAGWTVLAGLAALINPYGWRLYAEVLSFAGNPNLADMVEWKPLQIDGYRGRMFFLTAGGLLLMLRFSPRRILAGEVILIGGIGLLSLWSARFAVWWFPLAIIVLARHTSAIATARGWWMMPRASSRSLFWAVVAAVGLLAAVLSTPVSRALLRGTKLPLQDVVAKGTPLKATAYLREHPPTGQVFNTMEWGDYLIWGGPPEIRVFAASHVHLLPAEVWRDYLAMTGVVDGWENLLSKYDVQTVVIDRWYRRGLVSRLDISPHWRRVHQDSFAAIYVRRNP